MQLNPFARIETIRGTAGEIDGLRIVAPVKGRGLQTTLMLRAEDAAGFVARRRTVLSALLDAQSDRDPWPSLSYDDRAFVHRAGLFLDAGEQPAPVSFDRCAIDGVTIDEARLRTLRAALGTDGVALQPRLVSGAALDELRRYDRALVAEGYTTYGGEGGEPNRWVLHNDPLSRAMHPGLVPLVSSIAGEPLKPSFSYLLVYLAGASLERHRDRAQCAVTAIVQVDFDPEPQGATPWPLRFVGRSDTVDITLALGDLVVFRGTEIDHYRDPFTCGRLSTSLAFCFVAETFEGSLD